jgi:hypothetical protein
MRLLNANAFSAHSVLVGGRHSHLSIILTAQEYAVIAYAPFEAHLDPGTLPVIAPGMDNMEANRTVCLHNEFRRINCINTEYNNVDAALKRHIVQQFDGMRLAAVEDCMVGIANVTSSDLLLYLGENYGHLIPTELDRNCNLVTTHYDMQDPVETLLTHIDKGVHYAESGQHIYHDAQYVNIAFLLILDTGTLDDLH